MMRMLHAGAVATFLVIFLGVAMIVPTFTRRAEEDLTRVILLFDVADTSSSGWCDQLSKLIDDEEIKATVFFTGKFARAHPESVRTFSEGVDIGSQTYTYANLTSIPDYTVKLREVKNGKLEVDLTCELDSKLFRAPYGSTDGDIYSLLSRSGIIADFSYSDHYNVFYEGQFIRMEVEIREYLQGSADSYKHLPKREQPVIIVLNESIPIDEIRMLISSLRSMGCRFINVSELTGLSLTARE